MRIFAGNAREIRKSEKKTSDHFRLRAKKTPAMQALERLSKKSVFAILTLPRGSAHEIEIAQRFHKNRGRVPRFLYLEREKVSEWELSDVRVLRSQNTDCRKNVSFSTDKAKTLPISRKGQWSLWPDSNRRPAHYECAAHLRPKSRPSGGWPPKRSSADECTN